LINIQRVGISNLGEFKKKSKFDDIEITGIYSQDSQIVYGNNFTIYLNTLNDFTYFSFCYNYPLFSHENAVLLKDSIINFLNKL
jgi:hypothetical protein